VRARLRDDDERPKVLFRKFFGRSHRTEVLGFDIDRTTNLECGHFRALCIHRTLVSLLHKGHLFTKEVVERVEIDRVLLCLYGRQISLRVDGNAQVVAFVGEERRHTCCCIRGIIVCELCERQELGPVVLLVVTIDAQVPGSGSYTRFGHCLWGGNLR
jgi:hypothetical protein